MSTPAIEPPPPRLNSFPWITVDTDFQLYRAGHPSGPWWFNSAREDAQRFDLPAPYGTCYLATGVEAAIREKARERISSTGTVTLGFAESWFVYDLRLPSAIRAANTVHENAARFRLTRELFTILDISISCAWAAGFHQAQFGGIAYASRFTTGPGWNALALFGDTGARDDWPYTNRRTGAQAMDEVGIGGLISDREGLEIIDPPGAQ